MKTPREILLQKHQAAMPSLDTIRGEVLRMEVAPRLERQPSAGILQTFWEQLILPARRTWTGLACIWVVVFVLHGAASSDESPRHAIAAPAPLTSETRIALQQQERLMAELLNGEPPATPARPPIDGPRSERRPAVRCA